MKLSEGGRIGDNRLGICDGGSIGSSIGSDLGSILGVIKGSSGVEEVMVSSGGSGYRLRSIKEAIFFLN